MMSKEITQETVESHMPLVRMIAGRMIGKLPASVDYDDLVGYGVLGLMHALHEFDPERKVKFSTFAFYRIRGAMLDGLRALDWLPRPLRQKIHQMQSARAELASQLCREPSEEEVASKISASADEVRSLMFNSQQAEVVSLEEQIQERVSGDGGQCCSNSLEEADVISVMTESIRKLDQREQLILTLYYYEGLNLKEIGRVLDVSESRVSQLLAQAIGCMRERMHDVHSEIQA